MTAYERARRDLLEVCGREPRNRAERRRRARVRRHVNAYCDFADRRRAMKRKTVVDCSVNDRGATSRRLIEAVNFVVGRVVLGEVA